MGRDLIRQFMKDHGEGAPKGKGFKTPNAAASTSAAIAPVAGPSGDILVGGEPLAVHMSTSSAVIDPAITGALLPALPELQAESSAPPPAKKRRVTENPSTPVIVAGPFDQLSSGGNDKVAPTVLEKYFSLRCYATVDKFSRCDPFLYPRCFERSSSSDEQSYLEALGHAQHSQGRTFGALLS